MKIRLNKYPEIICIISFMLVIITISGCSKKEGSEEQSAISYADIVPREQQPVIMRDDKTAAVTESAEETETAIEPESIPGITPYPDRIAEGNPVSYNIETSVYEEGGIKVTYPQLAAMDNGGLQQQINENIKKFIVDSIYTEELSSYEMKYETAAKGTWLVSFVFNGYVNYEGGIHPSRVVKTLNIDLNTGKNIRLKEYADIAGVVSCLEQQSGYSVADSAVNAADFSAFLNNGAVTDYAMTLLDYDIDFDNPDLIYAGFSAIRNNHLVLFVPAEHAMGDYVELEFDKDL